MINHIDHTVTVNILYITRIYPRNGFWYEGGAVRKKAEISDPAALPERSLARSFARPGPSTAAAPPLGGRQHAATAFIDGSLQKLDKVSLRAVYARSRICSPARRDFGLHQPNR